MCIYVCVHTHTHTGEVIIQSTDACELIGSSDANRPFLKPCPVWQSVLNKKIPLASISSTHSTADRLYAYA